MRRRERHYCEYHYLSPLHKKAESDEHSWKDGGGKGDTEHVKKRGIKELGHIYPISIVPIINSLVAGCKWK